MIEVEVARQALLDLRQEDRSMSVCEAGVLDDDMGAERW
jgi:hypothetical protein